MDIDIFNMSHGVMDPVQSITAHIITPDRKGTVWEEDRGSHEAFSGSHKAAVGADHDMWPGHGLSVTPYVFHVLLNEFQG